MRVSPWHFGTYWPSRVPWATGIRRNARGEEVVLVLHVFHDLLERLPLRVVQAVDGVHVCGEVVVRCPFLHRDRPDNGESLIAHANRGVKLGGKGAVDVWPAQELDVS